MNAALSRYPAYKDSGVPWLGQVPAHWARVPGRACYREKKVYRTPACRVELRQKAKGIVQGFWRLYTDDFYDIRVPVPPVSEQYTIMEQLNSELSDLARAVDRAQREIALLREYRTRLIADVVTGKLDVRAAAAQLPTEAEEPEPPAEANALSEPEEDADDLGDLPQEDEE